MKLTTSTFASTKQVVPRHARVPPLRCTLVPCLENSATISQMAISLLCCNFYGDVLRCIGRVALIRTAFPMVYILGAVQVLMTSARCTMLCSLSLICSRIGNSLPVWKLMQWTRVKEVQLKYTSLVVSSVAGDDILNLFTDRLESASQRSWTTVDIVGIDIGDYKYTLFEQYLMEDIYYFVLAAFLIFLIMLLYLQSVLAHHCHKPQCLFLFHSHLFHLPCCVQI